jgi:hypothetical protein
MEEWKEITDYPNYEISNLGNIRNKNNNLIPYLNKSGYYCIKLYTEEYPKLIHKLIAEAFIPNPNSLFEIDHIDRNRKNNSLDNLRWVSRSQNQYNRNMKTQKSTSKYRGVSLNKGINKWRVRIKMNGKDTHIGYFETEEEGARAFNEFVISHNLGEFVELNIIK